MIIPISAIKTQTIDANSFYSPIQYMVGIYFIIIVSIMVVVAVFLLFKILSRDVARASEPIHHNSKNTTAPNIYTTFPQASYFYSRQKTNVSINGHEIPIDETGDTHITMPLHGGEANIDVRRNSIKSIDGSSNNSSEVQVGVDSSSEIIIEDSQ